MATKTKRSTSTTKRKPAGKKAAKKTARFVYFFSAGSAEGDASMRNLLGGKGANLAEMAGLGLPVPPGFTITTAVCNLYDAAKDRCCGTTHFRITISIGARIGPRYAPGLRRNLLRRWSRPKKIGCGSSRGCWRTR